MYISYYFEIYILGVLKEKVDYKLFYLIKEILSSKVFSASFFSSSKSPTRDKFIKFNINKDENVH